MLKATVTYFEGSGRIPQDVIDEVQIHRPEGQYTTIEEFFNYVCTEHASKLRAPAGVTQINLVVWEDTRK